MLRSLALALTGTLAGLTTVCAADLPARTAPYIPAAVPMFTWTGFYAGLNVGYGLNTDRIRSPYVGSPGYRTLANAGLVPDGYTFKPEGVLGGGQIGYNLQFGSVVVGLEADIQGSDIRSRAASTGTAAPGLVTGRSRLDLEWFGTVRGRLGFVAAERLLVYGTGGLIYGGERQDSQLTAGALPRRSTTSSSAVESSSRA